MKNQPIINVGTTGHVTNGKSTLVKCLSGKETQQFSLEKESNKTIKLGYANAKIWRCLTCEPPKSFSSSDSKTMNKFCEYCDKELDLVNHVSFVDCPGHHELIATMMNGSSVMDYAILVESCNNTDIPAPQTAEHLNATMAANIPTCMTIMNKIDIVNKKIALDRIKTITDYFKSLALPINAESNELSEQEPKYYVPPIVPVSGTLGINIDIVCEYLSRLQVPLHRNAKDVFKMIVVRSFDINKPGVDLCKLNGGVIGGTILRGMLNVGDKIDIYPGIYKSIPDDKKQKDGADFMYEKVTGEVLSIKSETNELELAVPGGLLGIQLTIDPAFTRNDLLAGSIVIKADSLTKVDAMSVCVPCNVPTEVIGQAYTVKVYDKIIIRMTTFTVEHNFENNEMVLINVNSNNIIATVFRYSKKKKELYLKLDRPIAIDSIDNLATVMNVNARNVIGKGIIFDGIECENIVW